VSDTPAVYADDRIQLLHGDARAVLSTLAAGSAHCVVTSPPYYGLRDYRARGQVGLEPHPQDYVDTLAEVFREVHRVLRDTGTLWLNLGDSYARPGNGTGSGHRAKTLLGMPWRVALALQEDGWILRNAIVWSKTNPMPSSVRDRLTTTYEHLFLLVKQPRYHFDLDAIRVPALTGTPRPRLARASRTPAKYARAESTFPRGLPGVAMRPTGARHSRSHPRGKNPGDVWALATRPLRHAHFAAFPVDIPRRAIAAGCPEGGHVLDPFSGVATTGLAALESGRTYTGIDINRDYHRLAIDRLALIPGVNTAPGQPQ
jgi:DNA modification methylase